MTDVLVAVATYRRNHHLVELVPRLVECADEVRLEGHDVRVLLVDNDPGGGAAGVLRPWVERGLVRYVHEPRPGLSAVRNRALAEARGARLLAFMDDDGRPEPGWLLHLVTQWELDHPGAVAGRVLESYEVPPDRWIVAGGFFRRRSLPTSTVVSAAPTTNLLLDVAVLDRHDLRFDERFGVTGGEDTFLTSQLTRVGERIVWCDESRVVDQVPASRMSRRWVLSRSFSHGNTTALVDQALAPDARGRWVSRARCATGGAARVVGGVAQWAAGLLRRSVTHRARGLRLAYRGAGMVVGALGRPVEEYER